MTYYRTLTRTRTLCAIALTVATVTGCAASDNNPTPDPRSLAFSSPGAPPPIDWHAMIESQLGAGQYDFGPLHPGYLYQESSWGTQEAVGWQSCGVVDRGTGTTDPFMATFRNGHLISLVTPDSWHAPLWARLWYGRQVIREKAAASITDQCAGPAMKSDYAGGRT